MENEQPIFCILCFEKANEELMSENGRPLGWPDMGEQDNVGFYYEKDTAIKALHENWGDMREYCYNAAFLLTHYPGLYQAATKEDRIYFVWDDEKQGFFEQEEPEIFTHIAL